MFVMASENKVNRLILSGVNMCISFYIFFFCLAFCILTPPTPILIQRLLYIILYFICCLLFMKRVQVSGSSAFAICEPPLTAVGFWGGGSQKRVSMKACN